MIHDYLIYFMTTVSFLTILVIALNIAVGFTGLINLGHMVFFGIGAYASAILTTHCTPWYVAILIAGLLASLIGTIIAAIAVRLKGEYFAMVTLGLVFIAIAIARNWISLTRGALGIPGVPDIIRDNFYYMIFSWAVAGLSILFFYNFVNSETGKILQAIRDDETAAAILGKNTYFYKVLSIAISTFFAGIAGSLFVHHINFIDPSVFDLEFFIFVISMLIAGGLASITGSIVGVFALSIVSEAMRYIIVSPELIGAVREITYVVVLILILVYRPKGIFGKVDV